MNDAGSKVAALMRLIDAYRDTWGGRPIDPKEIRAAVERELTASLTAQSSAAPAEWQPIETAPEGLVLTFEKGVYDLNWRIRNTIRPWHRGSPTHWMPLPAAPAASEEFSIPCADDATFQESHAPEPAQAQVGRMATIAVPVVLLSDLHARVSNDAPLKQCSDNELMRRISRAIDRADIATPQAAASVERVPLAEAEIWAELKRGDWTHEFVAGVRFAERHHGIGAPATTGATE